MTDLEARTGSGIRFVSLQGAPTCQQTLQVPFLRPEDSNPTTAADLPLGLFVHEAKLNPVTVYSSVNTVNACVCVCLRWGVGNL